jgi:hypothetical protein
MSGARIKTEEDEAWERLEAKQKRAAEIDKLQRAAVAAALFVSESPKRELAIMTLRKAFELGYRQGWHDKK